jgi:hypothetical protein
MNAYIKASLTYKFFNCLYIYYGNSLLYSFIQTLGIWVNNSETHKIISNYFEKVPTIKFSLTYRLFAFIFTKIDNCVGITHDYFLKYIKFSFTYTFFHALYQEGKHNFKTAVLLGLLFYMLGYSLMVTYLGHWAMTKLVFLTACFICILLIYKSVNVILWLKSSITYRVLKSLEE